MRRRLCALPAVSKIKMKYSLVLKKVQREKKYSDQWLKKKNVCGSYQKVLFKYLYTGPLKKSRLYFNPWSSASSSSNDHLADVPHLHEDESRQKTTMKRDQIFPTWKISFRNINNHFHLSQFTKWIQRREHIYWE